jgi:AraC family transcriptional regulator
MSNLKTDSRKEYLSRINRVQDYVKNNFDSDLSLDVLAEIGCFSKFYFNRVFRSVVGESLGNFVSRNRVEASAFKLLNNRAASITSIAYEYGFSSPAVYTRAFKDRYQLSPSQWRNQKVTEKSNICKVKSKGCKESSNSHLYFDSLTKQSKWRIEMSAEQKIDVEVRSMEAFPVAYYRHRGAYHPQDTELFQGMFQRLMAWAVPQNLFIPPETKALTVYSSGHPDTTEPENLCVDACISIPEDVIPSGEIGVRKIPAGEYAVITLHEATLQECSDAWDQLFEGWLPDSGYQPGEGAYYISHLNDPEQHPQRLHSVEMYLPVKPLQ